MELSKVTPSHYQALFPESYHKFNSVDFNLLNTQKCHQILFLLFSDNKLRIGLIAGIDKEENLLAPFSAPFGGFTANREIFRFEAINNAILLLNEYATQFHLRSIRITLAPEFYQGHLISQAIYALKVNGYIPVIDINYHFETNRFENYFNGVTERSTRKNYQRAINSGLLFTQVTSNSEKQIAYEIVRKNRESKDRPIFMSFSDLSDCEKIITIDYFLVHKEKQAIASAIVYRISPDVALVVFWGDLPGYQQFRPMNLVAFQVFEFYRNRNYKIIDIGPASENGVPNPGLCNFKENIGCTPSLKYTFIKNLSV